jgi:hypothetical protein
MALVYQTHRRVVERMYFTGYTASTNYLHNNWGWGSNANGYFAAGSFDSNTSHLTSNTKAGNAHNYQYNIEIFPYISK